VLFACVVTHIHQDNSSGYAYIQTEINNPKIGKSSLFVAEVLKIRLWWRIFVWVGDFFLKARLFKIVHPYNISCDNPQKDNFHKPAICLTDATFSDIRSVRWDPLR